MSLPKRPPLPIPLNHNRNPDLSREQIEDALRAHLGVSTVLWLGKGVFGDETPVFQKRDGAERGRRVDGREARGARHRPRPAAVTSPRAAPRDRRWH